MRRPAFATRGAAAAAGLASLLAVAAGHPAPAQAAGQRATYPGLVLREVGHATAVAVTDPRRVITLGVSLAHPDPAGEEAFARDLYDPGSAAYHHFLTPSAYAARFGVPAQRLAAVAGWLQAGGLRTVTIPGTTDYVLAAGTVAQVGRLLDVAFRDYMATDHRRHYANTSAPSAPASLGIAAIAGLNDLEGPHLLAHSPANTHRTAIGPNTNINLTTPQDLWDIYQQPAQNRGSGQTMAIFGWGVTDGVERDLRFEEKQFGLPGVPLTISHYGTEPVTDTGGAGEWRLDTQASTAMAPDVRGEKLYFGDAGSDPDLLAAYAAWDNDLAGPLQGSSSFGGCEEAPGTDALAGGGPGNPGGVVVISNTKQDMYTALLRQAVLEGRTMFASTGDTGSSCPVISVDVNGVGNELVPLLGFPAASPYAVAVGGTVLYWDGGDGRTPATRALEYAWPFTGGGTSAFLAAGDYQQGVPQIVGHCVVDNHGNPYTTTPVPLCRGVPDVAAQSGDGLVGPALVAGSNGFSITSGGAGGQAGGGTSLSSPLWLGMWTRIQAASATGTGFADPALYAVGKDSAKAATAFTDVVAGGNGYYVAAPGWDYVSGWGTPNVTALMTDIDGRITPVHPVAAAPVVSAVPTQLNPCAPLWTSPAGSDSYLGMTGQTPQMDLLSGDMQLLPDHRTLRTTLTVSKLDKTVPTGGASNDYYMLWSYKNVQYFSHVAVDPSGSVTFTDGQTNGNVRTDRSGATDAGQFNQGSPGTLVVDLPLSAVGSPSVGTILTSPTGETDETVGAPGVGGLLEPVDGGGPGNDYQVGQVCMSATFSTTSGAIRAASGASGGGAVIGLANTAAASPSGAPAGAAVLVLAGAAWRLRRRR